MWFLGLIMHQELFSSWSPPYLLRKLPLTSKLDLSKEEKEWEIQRC